MGGFSRRTKAAATVVWTMVGIFALWDAPALGAEPTAPPMAEGLATITELNFFTNFNTSAYSLTIGTLDIRAERRGPLCPGTAIGQQVAARYNSKVILLGPAKDKCKLTVRRMEFTGAPGTR